MMFFVVLLSCSFVGVVGGGLGGWGPVTPWPVIPVGVFHLDDGRLLGYAALQKDSFRIKGIPFAEQNYTQAAIWDPETGSFEDKDLDGHDIFCPGTTFLPNGDVFVGGGGNGPNSYRVSRFDMQTKTWVRHADMNGGHWYGTAVATDSEVVMMEGFDRKDNPPPNNFIPEKSSGFDFASNWSLLTGASFEDKINTNPAWYPQTHLMSNGKVIVSGTTNDMYSFDVSGDGSLTFVGQRNTDEAEQQAWGASTIMYRPGLLMALGGTMGWVQTQDAPFTPLSRVIQIDIRDPDNIKTSRLSPMKYGRGFQNAVLGPDGKVYVFGGTQIGKQFNDRKSILIPEVYDPATDTWTELAPMQTPRNYHSTAILLKDGRIFVGGGGLCGDCDANHQDHEIFTPPYLYDDSGSELAPRPEIHSIPESVSLGQAVTITVTGADAEQIEKFLWIRLHNVTHSLSTDLRGFFLNAVVGPAFMEPLQFSYSVQLPSNVNEMSRGSYWVYGVTKSGVPSVAVKVQVIA